MRQHSTAGHIHPGNVVIQDGNAKLVDIENSLIGQPSIYRHHLWEIRKIYVRGLGAVIFEGGMWYDLCNSVNSSSLYIISRIYTQAVDTGAYIRGVPILYGCILSQLSTMYAIPKSFTIILFSTHVDLC